MSKKSFEPIGGYPPLIRIENKIGEEKIESRSFENKNIINIKNIIDSKKKSTFIKLGMDEENGAEYIYDMLDSSPIQFENMNYHEI